MTKRTEYNGMLVSFASKIADWRYPIDFLRRIDRRNLGGFRRTLDILARPSMEDWWYGKPYSIPEVARAAKNFVFDPKNMNEFQQHSPEAGYTSTPEDGLLAGITARGRLSSLFYPHTGFTQQIPYTHTGRGRLGGSKPREGAFLGYRTTEGVNWLWESEFAHEMAPIPGTGILHVGYRPRNVPSGGGDSAGRSDRNGGISVDEHAYVVPTTETLARDFTIANEGTDTIRSLVYYMQANANDNVQYPIYNSNRNRATAGDELRWDDCESDVSLRTFPARASVTDSGVADASLADVLNGGRSRATGRRLGGYLELDVAIPPGERRTVTVFTAGRTNGVDDSPLTLTPDRRREFARDKWREYLESVETTSVPERHVEQYVRSVIGTSMLYDPASGSISASPNSQPTYYLSWPRDGSFIAIALAEAGMTDIAKDYLVTFCATVQEQDGSFEQCYASTGEPMGIIAVENDQPTIYPHAVRTVFDLTGDRSFLHDVWPVVERAADYTVGAVVDNGLLAATHDFAEMWIDARQSIWTNAFAYRGLLDAASLAEQVDAEGAAERYRTAARSIGDAVEKRLFDAVDDGFATHLSITGPERNENTAFAAAIHPTKWAEQYDHADELFEAFGSFYRSSTDRWLPKEFMYAAALYSDGRIDDGDAILDELGSECLPGGTLAEVVDEDGNHRYAALGWSNASFIHAIHERAVATDAQRDD